MSSRQTRSRNGAQDCLLVDGAPSEFAMRASASCARPLMANGKSQATGGILWLDDQRLTRQCMSEALQELCPDMDISGLRSDDYHHHTFCAQTLLIIVNLHGARIGEAVQRLGLDSTPPPAPLLFITARDERNETLEAMNHGAMGLVHATARIELLVAAIRLVIAGGRYYPAQAQAFPAPATKDFP